MKWLFIYRKDLVVCYIFALFLLVPKYHFHVDAERMKVQTREMLRNICVDG